MNLSFRLLQNSVFHLVRTVISSAQSGRAVCMAVLLAVSGTVPLSTRSVAQEVEKKSSIGNWSVYCLKNVQSPKIQDCSVATAAVADGDSNAWLRIALAFDSSPREIAMIVRTPYLNDFSKGISINNEQNQLGKAFIQRCDAQSWCQTVIHVDSRLLRGLAIAREVSFQYQVSDTESIALAVNFESFLPAIGELAKVLGFAEQPWELGDHTFKVELRTVPFNLGQDDLGQGLVSGYINGMSWGTPLKDCYGRPAAKMVTVSSKLEIQDDVQFEEWLSHSARCGMKTVLWILDDPRRPGKVETPLDAASKFTVYEKARDKMPRVVFANPSGIPLQATKGGTLGCAAFPPLCK